MRNYRYNVCSGRDWRLALAGLWLLALVILVGCSQLQVLRGEQPLPAEIQVGYTFLKQGQKEKAEGQFEAAIKAQPDNSHLYARIARVCFVTGHYDLSAKYAEQGLSALPNAPVMDRIHLFTEASAAYLEIGDRDRAIKCADEAVRYAPDHPHALNLLGYTIAEVYDVDMPGARAKLERALTLTTKAVTRAMDENYDDMNLGLIVDSVGWVHYKLHNYDEAIANLSRATDLAPRWREIHFHLGVAFQKKQRYADAITELKRALQLSEIPYPQAQAALDSIKVLLPPSSNQKTGASQSRSSTHTPNASKSPSQDTATPQ